MSRPDIYTPEDDARLMEMRAEGKSFPQIGAVLGRSDKSIASRHRRLTNRYIRSKAVDDDGEHDLRMSIWRRQRDGARKALAQMGAT